MRLGFFSKMNHTMHQRFDLQNPEVLTYMTSSTPKLLKDMFDILYINILSFLLYIYIIYFDFEYI